MSMNDTRVERQCDGTARFENGKMCRAADSDEAALDQCDAGLTGFNADVATTAKYGTGVALDDIGTHGALHSDGITLDGADGFLGRLVGDDRWRVDAHQ